MSLKEEEIQRLIQSGGTSEPNVTLLSDEEVLKYAPKSYEASKVKLKHGIGDFSDKFHTYEGDLIILGLFGFPIIIGIIVLSPIIGLFIFISVIVFLVYWFFIHDFTSEEYVRGLDEDLLKLFESKEKIAREMIEKKFPAPQLTNSKFNGVLDTCKCVVEEQIEILSVLTPTDKSKYELNSRKELVRQLIEKVDDLSNELALSDDGFDDVVSEMDDLIHSVKDY